MKKICSLIIVLLLVGTIVPIMEVDGSSGNSEGVYGYIIEVDSSQSYTVQENICRVVNKCLGEDFDVYWTNAGIRLDVTDLDGYCMFSDKLFKTGSFIVPFSGDFSKDFSLISLINSNSHDFIYMLMQSFSMSDLFKLVEPRIAHFDGAAANASYYEILGELGFTQQFILGPDDVNSISTDNFDVFIWGAQIGSIGDMLSDYFCDGLNDKIRNFVSSGGAYIGSCNGGYRAAKKNIIPAGLINNVPLLDRPLYKDTNYVPGGNLPGVHLGLLDCDIYRALPGGGDANVSIVPGSPITYGVKSTLPWHVYWAGPMFLNLGTNINVIATLDGETLLPYGWWDLDFMMIHGNVVGWDKIDESKKIEVFNNWKNYSVGKALWVESTYGAGKVVAFGGHPEFAYNGYYTIPCRIIYNTVFYVTSQGPFTVNFNHGYNFNFNEMSLNANGPYEAYVGNPVNFTATVADGYNPIYWRWNFGDGNQAFEQNPEHLYGKTGIYKVTLTASDGYNIDTAYATVEVISDLKIRLDIKDDFITTETPISYNVNVTTGIEPYSYLWDFGDGKGTSTTKSGYYLYDDIGIYHGTITVTDSSEAMATLNFSIAVNQDIKYLIDLFILTDDFMPTERLIMTTVYDFKNKDDDTQYLLNFSFGEGNTHSSGWISAEEIYSGFYGLEYELSHKYDRDTIRNYFLDLIVTDLDGDKYFAGEVVNIDNLNPPCKPSKPDGPKKIKEDKWYSYATSVIEPDGDQIYYGLISENCYAETYWGPFNSGEIAEVYITWDEPGTYEIYAQAEDEHGAINISDPLTVTVVSENNDLVESYNSDAEILYDGEENNPNIDSESDISLDPDPNPNPNPNPDSDPDPDLDPDPSPAYLTNWDPSDSTENLEEGDSIACSASGAGGSGNYCYIFHFGDGTQEVSWDGTTSHEYGEAGTFNPWVELIDLGYDMMTDSEELAVIMVSAPTNDNC